MKDWVILLFFSILIIGFIISAEAAKIYGAERLEECDELEENERWYCYTEVAEKQKNLDMCDLIEDNSTSFNCYQKFYDTGLDESLCERINERFREKNLGILGGPSDICFWNLANKESNFRECLEIERENERENCLSENASLLNSYWVKNMGLHFLRVGIFVLLITFTYMFFYKISQEYSVLKKSKKKYKLFKTVFFGLSIGNIFLHLINPYVWYLVLMTVYGIFAGPFPNDSIKSIFPLLFLYLVVVPSVLFLINFRIKNQDGEAKLKFYKSAIFCLIFYSLINIGFYIWGLMHGFRLH